MASVVAMFFVPVQINTQHGSANTTEILRRFRQGQVWTPDPRILTVRAWS